MTAIVRSNKMPEEKFSSKVLLAMHEFLHGNRVGSEMVITINEQRFKLEILKNEKGLRYMIYRGKTFVEQNRRANTVYGQLAADGHYITWGPGQRLRIVDSNLYYDGIKVAGK